ncbi:CENPX protein, partial [Erithacus rubecula]|nr:CENPX protein [Erithacus rubecula]
SSVPLSAQDTVDRLLRLHFRDGRTRVNADAQLLMAEFLKVFVRAGPPRSSPAPAPQQCRLPDPSHCPSLSSAAEAASRAARQAQAEDLRNVETEQLEKVLPQLVCNC